MKKGINIVALLVALLLTGCAGGGITTSSGTSGWLNAPVGCKGKHTAYIDGEVIECLTEESMIALYKANDRKLETIARYKAVENTKGDAAAQVHLAYMFAGKTELNLKKSKTWDERLFPYWQTSIQLWSGGILGDGRGNALNLEGDGNEIHIGDTSSKFGRDGVQQKIKYDYTYDYDYINTQNRSPNANTGAGHVDNGVTESN